MLIITVLPFLYSCNKNDKNKTIITQHIEYDVFIKSPEPNDDWWLNNIEGQNRYLLVNSIIDAAFSGKIKVYDYHKKELSKVQLQKIQVKIDTFLAKSPFPPFNDTLIVSRTELDVKNITKIRFIEEWSLDNTDMNITKRTLGFAPLIERYTKDGELMGYSALFWVYTDKNFFDSK